MAMDMWSARHGFVPQANTESSEGPEKHYMSPEKWRMWGVALTEYVHKASCTVLHDCSAFKPLSDCMHHSHGIISQISDIHLDVTQDHTTVAPLDNSKSRTTPAQSAQHWGPEGNTKATCRCSSMAE